MEGLFSLILVLVVIAFVVTLVGAVAKGIWHLTRGRAFRKLGWEHVHDPDPRVVWGLNRPPFGRGNGRRVHELVSGTADGLEFRAVTYSSDTDRPGGFLVILSLPRSMPPFGHEPDFDDAVRQALGPTASEIEAAGLDLSIDGAALVGLGVGSRADELQAALPLLTRAAHCLSTPALAGFEGPPVPPEMALVEHPDWVYRERDDSMLDHVRAAGGGFAHEAHDVVFLASREVGFITLTHTWKTRRTVTESGPNGTTTTRTVEDKHSEELFEITLGFPFADLSVNKSFDWGRGRVLFESEDFNREFAVRCRDARFASNVFHPRQMQFLQQVRPPAFEIERGRMRVEFDGRLQTIEWWLDFADGFFGRVPEYVWKDQGIEPPRLMRRWLAGG